jgi:hypothetical protein
MSIIKNRLVISLTFLLLVSGISAQVKPKVNIIGGDNHPEIKNQIKNTLEMILLEVNRQKKGNGNLDALKSVFVPESFRVFSDFILKNKAYTARKEYQPQMIERLSGESFDIRSIIFKVDLGETEASDNQSLVFTFSKLAIVQSVRTVLLNYDYQTMISKGTSHIDSLTYEKILEFIEQFRMAYNSKDIEFLEKIYSDDALIITGSVIKERKSNNEILNHSFLTQEKIKLVQQTKMEYLDAIKNKAFKQNSYLNIRFEDLKILKHEKIPYIYGISCWQYWNSSKYSDKGYLFLMMDFRNPLEPVVNVRTWQPKAFDNDGDYISLYDFDVVSY